MGVAEVPREYYDLISVIMIRLNDQMESSDGTLRMLQTLCSKSAGKQKKLEELKKSGIYTDKPLEGGINEMCNLSEAIYRDGKQEGRLEGRLEGSKKANIRTICKMLVDNMPAKKIVQFVDMDEHVVRQVIELAHGNISCDDGNIDRIYMELYQEQINS